MQLSTHCSTSTLSSHLEELWTGWLCQGEGKPELGRRGLEISTEMIGGAQGPHLSGSPLDTSGVVLAAVLSSFMAEVTLGGQCQQQRMVFSSWILGEKPTAQCRAVTVGAGLVASCVLALTAL